MPLEILNDQPAFIERSCNRCQKDHLVTLREADSIPPDSFINLCSNCLTAVFIDRAHYSALDEFFEG